MVRALVGAIVSVVLATPAFAEDKFFDSNGVRIRYVEQGSGEPILLIHGLTVTLDSNWIDTGVFANLAKDHHVIAFDLRGHGKSGKPHDGASYGRELVQDAVRLLDHLKIDRAHIVGYSLGATVVAKLLTTNPERFLTGTLAGSSGSRNWTPADDQTTDKWAAELESDVPFRRLVTAITPTDGAKLTEEEIRAQSQAIASHNDVLAIEAFYKGGYRALEEDDAEIAAVKVPVLGIVGSADGAVRGFRQLQMLLPAMTLVVIDGATHSGERGAARRTEFTEAIRRFIAANKAK
jgi:pimeloyl-ACP methyl ester carboxylesterase